jgi:hypothetical protein
LNRPEKEKAPQIQSDGIALDTRNGYFYYHALTGHTLYRIKTRYLTDKKLSKSEISARIETVTKTPATKACWRRRMVRFT